MCASRIGCVPIKSMGMDNNAKIKPFNIKHTYLNACIYKINIYHSHLANTINC